MSILALDPGTQLGWAVLDDLGVRIASGAWDLSRPIKPTRRGVYFLRARAKLDALIGDHADGLTLIVYERVFQHSGEAQDRMYGGIVGTIEACAAAWDLDVAGVAVPTWKKALTGNPNASAKGGTKPPTKTARKKLGAKAPDRVFPSYLAAARAKWGDVIRTEDEAAACGIADAARLGLHVTVKKAKKRRKTA